jgi:hypothetical protein
MLRKLFSNLFIERMKSHTFKLDSPQAYKLKIVCGLLVGVGGIPLLFWGLSVLKGHGNDLSEWGEKWWPVGLMVMVVGVAIGVYASYGYYSLITFSEQANLGLRVNLKDPGSELDRNGKWKWFAYYVEVPLKYGMVKKECHLVLFHKEKALCELMQDLGPLTEEPAKEFLQLPGSIGLPVTMHRTGNINEILKIIKTSAHTEQVQPSANTKQPETQPIQPAQTVGAPKTTKQGQPEYGDPDYDL